MKQLTGVRRLALGAFSIVAFGVPAEAQVAKASPPPLNVPTQVRTSDVARWEIEGHAGLAMVRIPSSGSSALPDPGPPLTTSSPIFPSRQTSSWFFGDGAELLNGVNAEFEVPSRIEALDSALDSPGLAGDSRGAFGLRIRRGVTPRVSAEFNLDVMTGSSRLSDELVAAVESSRTSFETALRGLFASGPFVNTIVEATAVTNDGSSREIAATGALTVRLGTFGSFAPYASLGAGVISRAGDLPSATLEGRYRTTIGGAVPIDETDRVTVRYEQAASVVAVLGAGLRREVSDRWGFQIDGRAFVGRSTTRLLLDANPSVARGTPADFIESFTFPSIQFSNDPATGRQSSLSGPAIEGFAAFTGEGMQTRFVLTVGVFRRF